MFAAAPHEPIPEDVIHRFLELNTTSCSEEIAAAVKNCGFISRNPEWKTQPQDSHDTVATLHVHLRTLEALREVFPRNGTCWCLTVPILHKILYEQSCTLLLYR